MNAGSTGGIDRASDDGVCERGVAIKIMPIGVGTGVDEKLEEFFGADGEGGDGGAPAKGSLCDGVGVGGKMNDKTGDGCGTAISAGEYGVD